MRLLTDQIKFIQVQGTIPNWSRWSRHTEVSRLMFQVLQVPDCRQDGPGGQTEAGGGQGGGQLREEHLHGVPQQR